MPTAPFKGPVYLDRFPKSRIDSLTDGVFAFAMTLLVLDVRVPSNIGIETAEALTSHLFSLWHQLLVYVLSFFVLGNLWRASIVRRPRRDHATATVLTLWLSYLFFVTMVPFSSGLVGRYGEFQPATVVYSINMATLGVLVVAIRYLEGPVEMRSLAKAAGLHLPVFIGTALLAIGISFVEPRHAMFAYFLNFVTRLHGFAHHRKVAMRRKRAPGGGATD